MRTFRCEHCDATVTAIAVEAWCSCTTRLTTKAGKPYGRSGHPLMVLVRVSASEQAAA